MEKLIKEYSGYINKIIMSRYNRGNQDHDEIYQKTLIKIWKNKKQFNSNKGKLTTWIYQITSNIIADHYRVNFLELTKFKYIKDLKYPLPESLIEYDNPEHILERKYIDGLKNKLSNKKRKLIDLKEQGLSDNKIAKILKIKVGTVYSRFNRIKEELKQYAEK